MDKVRNLIAKHSGKIKYLFLCGAIIAAINTLSRADYNFVLYLYMFYVWTFMGNSAEEQRQDKIGTFYLLFYSLLIDIFWCLFWGSKWDNIPTVAHELTLLFSWCGIIVKIFVICLVGIMELDVIKSSLLQLLKAKDNRKSNFSEFIDE